MSFPPPDVLRSLLSAPDAAARESAWTAFLAQYSDLMLHVARHQGGDHDAAMDRYLFVIQALQANDCHRLRAYTANGDGKFTTWLLVVTRRLCFDHHRARYGRAQSDTDASTARQAQRRQLVDLLGGEVGVDGLEAPSGEDAEARCRREELRQVLLRALDQLSAPDRLLLRFRFEDGLSVPEIARLVGVASPFAMYRRLDKVLTRLRVVLNASGVEDSVP